MMTRLYTRRLSLLATTTLLLVAALSGRGQTPPGPPLQTPRGGTAAIAGHVVDEAGRPVTDAVVTLAGRGGAVDRVVVDPRGRFVFRDLPAGGFGVVATRPGYLGGGIDQHDPTSAPRPVDLTDNQVPRDVTLRLWMSGAIAGTVLGDAGAPLPGVEIHALRRALIGGRWILSAGATTTTDDLGRYRIDGLAPGDYAVVARPDRDPETALLLAMLSANPAVTADVLAGLATTNSARPEPDDRVRNYPMTFYPAAPALSGATLVTLAPGSERAKTDFRLKPAKVVRVSGALANVTGAADGITLELVPADAGGVPAPVSMAVTACDELGRFEFSSVPPGRYLVGVQAAPPQPPAGQPGPPPNPQALPAGPAWSGSVPVVVGATDVTNVSVPVQRTVVMSGRIMFEGTAARPAPAQIAQITVRLDPVDRTVPTGAATWRGQVDSDGRLRTMIVPPGEYLLRIGAPPRGWTLLSAIHGGQDILDTPVTIGAGAVDDVAVTFGDGPLAAASGSVRNARGANAADASVLVFPADRALWRDSSAQARRLRLARSTATGRFGVPGLPAGEYFLVAVDGELPGEWQDPSRLEALSTHATRARLVPGTPQQIDLTVIATPGLKTRGSMTSRSGPPSGPAPAKASTPSTPALKSRPPSGPAPSPDPTRTAAVAGTVLDQTTHRPMENAMVMIAGTDVGLVRVTATDEHGRFTFAGLPAGHFLIGAGKPSYLTGLYGASRPGRPGTALAIEAGRRADDVSIALVRGGVIAGRVTGDGGRPVPGARVRVTPHRAFAGEVAMTGDAGSPAVVTTDAQGAYRVFDLPPGEYAVAVQARGIMGGDVRRLTEADVDGGAASTASTTSAQANGMAVGWAPRYYPGTSSPAEAGAIVIAAGEVRTNVDVPLALARFVRVEGMVSGVGSAAPNLQVTLRPRGLDASGVILTNLTTRPGPDGRFMFPNVPPGAYAIVARSLPPPAPPDRQFAGAPPVSSASAVRWATAEISVKEENVADLALTLRAGLTVTGQVQLEGGARLPADLPIIRVGLRPTPGSSLQNPQNVTDLVPIDRDGRFAIAGLVPGRYRIYLQVPNNDVLQVPTWFARTAVIDGINSGDALDVPFDLEPNGVQQIFITLTTQTQELDGIVRDAAGHPVRDCTVIAFPVDRRFWFQQSRRIVARQSDRDGRFVFGVAAGLPAGEYFLAAVPDGRPGDQLDVLLLDELTATAVKVSLGANESRTVDLRIR